MNIVQFEIDTPITVALQSEQGTRVAGRYGDRVMFALADGRTMYVPPAVASRIEAEGIKAGEPFQLAKVPIKTGVRRGVKWDLQRTETLVPGLGSKEKPAGDYGPTEPCRSANENDDGSRRTLDPQALDHSGIDYLPKAPLPTKASTKLEQALKTAIAAAHNAERYGADLGYVVRFDSDAIKSMAITVLINMSEGARK